MGSLILDVSQDKWLTLEDNIWKLTSWQGVQQLSQTKKQESLFKWKIVERRKKIFVCEIQLNRSSLHLVYWSISGDCGWTLYFFGWCNQDLQAWQKCAFKRHFQANAMYLISSTHIDKINENLVFAFFEIYILIFVCFWTQQPVLPPTSTSPQHYFHRFFFNKRDSTTYLIFFLHSLNIWKVPEYWLLFSK